MFANTVAGGIFVSRKKTRMQRNSVLTLNVLLKGSKRVNQANMTVG